MTRDAGYTDGERYERGMTVRREVLSDEHVDRASAGTTDLTKDFQDFITRVAWGDIWSRPGLDRRSRSIAVLSTLIADGVRAGAAARIDGAAHLPPVERPEETARALLDFFDGLSGRMLR